MGLINVSNSNYIKVNNLQISLIDGYLKVSIEIGLYKDQEQRRVGPMEFETFYLKQIDLNDFTFINDKNNPIDNLKTGAYLTLRKIGYDDQNWFDA